MHAESMLAHGLFENPSGGASPALDRSTTFERWPPEGTASPYGRGVSPTAEDAERLLGALEDAEALVFSSGMSAWTCLAFTLLRPGRAVAIPDEGYYGTETFCADLLEPFGVEVRRYAAGELAALAAAARGAALVLAESPANPTMTVIDLAAAAEAAHAGGALLVADNTVATPLGQRPLDLGADLTWQSGTKSLAGHSDALAGVLATRDGELAERLGHTRYHLGSILGPDPAWLLVRGLRTLAVRLDRQAATALDLAGRLAGHPAVRRVRYPGLPDDPGHELARRQMTRFGALLAFELGDEAAAAAVEDALRLARRATSLGSVETLAERRSRIEPAGRLPDGLIRIAVGLEHADDLWDDLEGALARAPAMAAQSAGPDSQPSR